MLKANVAEGVHRIEDSHTNWYLLEEDGRVTVVDACVPTSWGSLTYLGAAAARPEARRHRGARADARHFDHIGIAKRLRTRERRAAHAQATPVRPRADAALLRRDEAEGGADRGFVPAHERAFWPKPIGEVRR